MIIAHFLGRGLSSVVFVAFVIRRRDFKTRDPDCRRDTFMEIKVLGVVAEPGFCHLAP